MNASVIGERGPRIDKKGIGAQSLCNYNGNCDAERGENSTNCCVDCGCDDMFHHDDENVYTDEIDFSLDDEEELDEEEAVELKDDL